MQRGKKIESKTDRSEREKQCRQRKSPEACEQTPIERPKPPSEWRKMQELEERARSNMFEKLKRTPKKRKLHDV